MMKDEPAYAGWWSRGPGDIDARPLLRDHSFNKDSLNVKSGWRHVSPLAQGQNQVGVDGIQVRLIQGLPPRKTMAKVMGRALNATTGVDISESPDVTGDEWEDLLRGGLQAVMEAFVLVFEVSGVSRACTHQLVRSRRAGFHQQSQRATRYADPSTGIGPNVRVPESLWEKAQDNVELAEALGSVVYWTRKAYELACRQDVSYQDARYILPEGTTNYILCEYTLREFLAVYSYRACSMFNWEIVHVVREMGALLKAQSPWIKGTGAEPKISCERTPPQSIPIEFGPSKTETGYIQYDHQCTFQGWEQVEHQCDFPWATEENRAFKPSKGLTIGGPS